MVKPVKPVIREKTILLFCKVSLKVNSITVSNDDIHIINIVHSISDKAIFGKIIVNNNPVKIYINSGASVNVQHQHYVSC